MDWSYHRIQMGKVLASKDLALKGTAAAPELWGAVYMLLVFAVLVRALRAWERYGAAPIGWQELVTIGVDLLICPAPLLVGLAFRRLVTRELGDSRLNARTYTICNFRIAQLLILTYVSMVL
jgi:hypothetical protein